MSCGLLPQSPSWTTPLAERDLPESNLLLMLITSHHGGREEGVGQFHGAINTRHGPQPAVYPNTTEITYVAALKKADTDAQVQRLEKEIDQLQEKLDQFNYVHQIEVDGRTLELAS